MPEYVGALTDEIKALWYFKSELWSCMCDFGIINIH